MISTFLWHYCVLFSTLYVGGLAQHKGGDPSIRAPRSNGLTLATLPPSRVIPTLITPPPQINHQGLIARAGLATCGYVSGNAASPLTCPNGYTCMSTVQLQVAWACCNQIQCVGNHYICQNWGDNLCLNLDQGTCSSIYTSVLSCSSANPSCFAYARSSSLGDSTTQYSLGCGKSSGDVLALITTTGGPASAGAATSNGAALPSLSPSSLSPFSGDLSPSSSTSSPGSIPFSSPTPSPDSNNGWSQGTIAGVAVAAIAAVAAIIVGFWKRHQVTWLFTCGAYGHRHSQRPPTQPPSAVNLNNWHTQPQNPSPNPTFNINNSSQQLRNGDYTNYGNSGHIYR